MWCGRSGWWHCGTGGQAGRRDAVRRAPLVAPGLGDLSLGDGHESTEYTRRRGRLLQLPQLGPARRPRGRGRASGRGRRQAARRTPGTGRGSPRRHRIWRGRPSTRASRAHRSRSSWCWSSRYSQVSSSSAPGSGARGVVLGGRHGDPRAGRLQTARARAGDLGREGQLQVQAVGRGLQVEPGRHRLRLDQIVLAAQHDRVEVERQPDVARVAGLQPECAKVERFHTVRVDASGKRSGRATSAGSCRTRPWPGPCDPRSGPPAVRGRAARRPGTWSGWSPCSRGCCRRSRRRPAASRAPCGGRR